MEPAGYFPQAPGELAALAARAPGRLLYHRLHLSHRNERACPGDPGRMLHPRAGYARWRSTLDTRNLPCTRVRQGSSISLGTQMVLQVLWPPEHLHKGSDEVRDNALILRLLAPGLSMLLLNTAVPSSDALQSLLAGIGLAYLQALSLLGWARRVLLCRDDCACYTGLRENMGKRNRWNVRPY